MSYCKKMNRTCSCDRLVTYDERGRVSEQNNAAACLTDDEMRHVLMTLLTEWRQRMEADPSPVYDARH